MPLLDMWLGCAMDGAPSPAQLAVYCTHCTTLHHTALIAPALPPPLW